MSAHDKAYELARLLSQSTEYNEYIRTKKKVEEDERVYSLLKDFQQRQFDFYMSQIAGEEEERESEDKLEKLYQIISLYPSINEYLTAEYKLSRLYSEIQNILGEALDEWVDYEKNSKDVNLN